MIYDITVKDAEGKDVSLNKYRGKVLLIVNTATGCGYTPQYEGLQALYEEYHANGLEILDFPCNQFGNQAPGSIKEIKDFCKLKYNVSFPQFGKLEVNGENAAPLYKFLKAQRGGLFGSNIKWNFTKFLVDRNGWIVKRYAPSVKPEKLEKDILKLLFD